MDFSPGKDYYRILGVSRTANSQELKERYRKLALELHPDRCSDAASIDRFKAISEAYQILNHSDRRKQVDDYLEGRRFHRNRLNAEESFMDRLAGVNRRTAGRSSSFGGRSSFYRLMEIALAPRVIGILGGLMFMSYIAFGPRDDQEELLVPAWYNQRSKRWETPAPWLPDYASSRHAKVNRHLVFPSSPP